MPEKSYLNMKDELDDEPNSSELEDYLLGGSDSGPYDSIVDRQPLDEGRAAGEDATLDEAALHDEPNEVRDAIMSRSSSRYHPTAWRNTPPRAYTLAEFKNDPLMQQNEESQKDLEHYRQAKLHADAMSNMGQSFVDLARGASPPLGDRDLYRNIERQNSDMLKSKTQDLERRAGVIEAIERRKTRERVAQEYANSRRDVASMNQTIRQENADKNGAAADNRLLNDNIRTTNTIFGNPNITQEVTKANAARSVQTLISSIESGELTDSKNISKQLTNLMATIELGTPGGQSDREAMGVDTLYTTAKTALGYIGSSATSTIPKQYLQQLKTEGNALGQRAVNNYKVLTDSSLAGTDGPVKELGTRRQQEFLRQSDSSQNLGQQIESATDADGFVRVRTPEGKVRKVPADQAEDAITRGNGKLVQ